MRFVDRKETTVDEFIVAEEVHLFLLPAYGEKVPEGRMRGSTKLHR
jgi:hypothetical protein